MEKTDCWSTKKKIGKWDFNRFDFEELEGDQQHSCNWKLTWPSKYYTCSFCKREFRSAQALGGHMNVHRKDRARLRLLSSWVLECQNPNPNPNPNSSPSNLIPSHSADSSVYPHHSSLLSPLVSTTTPSSSLLPWEDRRKPLMPQLELLSKGETMAPFLGVEKLNMHAQNYELEVGGVTGLDLEGGFQDSKEVLDLELRLG